MMYKNLILLSQAAQEGNNYKLDTRTLAEKDSDNLGLIGACCPLIVLQKNTKPVMTTSVPTLAILLICMS